MFDVHLYTWNNSFEPIPCIINKCIVGMHAIIFDIYLTDKRWS